MPTRNTTHTVIINLTTVEGCYSKPLTENIDTICQYANDSFTSCSDLISWILELIEPAKFNKDAKPRFKHHLRNCRTKQAVLKLCCTAIANALEYEAVA
jgi:hypothetical protein